MREVEAVGGLIFQVLSFDGVFNRWAAATTTLLLQLRSSAKRHYYNVYSILFYTCQSDTLLVVIQGMRNSCAIQFETFSSSKIKFIFFY